MFRARLTLMGFNSDCSTNRGFICLRFNGCRLVGWKKNLGFKNYFLHRRFTFKSSAQVRATSRQKAVSKTAREASPDQLSFRFTKAIDLQRMEVGRSHKYGN